MIQEDDKQLLLVDYLLTEKHKIEKTHEFWQHNKHDLVFSSNHEEKKAKANDTAKNSFFSFLSSKPEEDTKKKREEKVERFISQTPFRDENFVQGSYIWGDTGCGKTFLLDLFFDHIQIEEKKRFHYNKFMLRIHKSNFKYYNVVL